jgi:predicted RNA-binding Zn ribbon-like protein
MDLATLEEFVNTADLNAGTDRLADLAGLTTWAADAGLAGTAFDEADRERIVAFREALRQLLLGRVDPEALGDARLIVFVAPDGAARLAPAERGADGVIAALLAVVARAQAEGTWSRMKACPADGCHWAFYDRSRNRSRTWCSMSECGNRAKARGYRARQR